MSIVADYLYTDHHGRPVIRKIRREPKGFRMYAARYKGDRLYWKTGVQRWQPEWAEKALFNLPVLLAALQAGEPVYMTEGERDAEAFSSLQKLPVTTNWQGAGKFTREQAEWFLWGGGRSDITIFLDRDDAGHFAAWQRYSLLVGVGVAPSRITMLRPRATRHKDLTDVALDGLSRSAFRPVSPRRARLGAERYGAERAARYTFAGTA
ncbi:toprim domain-containing protein [Nocardioides mangrovi]|uniref:Toprim domain-containing protein n=1 Tax=Nocardioides mangrovi TaxID=2874580 RepID=A0ABS7UG77_9ACTN|nr:toprim domain-containing protein [Nocardioides mangrovi]MBZ5739772.1 toprim domain-containing protein [Nocardioides mangrovi]